MTKPKRLHPASTVKLRLALHRMPIRSRDDELAFAMQTGFDGLVGRTRRALVEYLPMEAPLYVAPIEYETTIGGQLIGATTLFQVPTSRPKRFRKVIQRLAHREEQELWSKYRAHARVEVSEVWQRDDGSASA